ncbi:MAG: AAA family ATPase [Candidatus Tyrphobacter sp.]
MKYILGYALGSKEDAEQSRADFASVMREASARDDFGAEVLFAPSAGNGKRPSSIFAHGVSSLESADLEMQSVAQGNPRCREPVMHVVFSLCEGIERSDEEFVAGVRDALSKLGLDEHAYVIAVHRDTDSVHAHCAISSINSRTLQAWERYKSHTRIDAAMREVEKERGWEHDRGLVIVDSNTQAIRHATSAELKIWGDERRGAREAERLARLEIRKEFLDKSFAEKADKTIGPRLQMGLDAIRDRGEAPDWSELHLISAKYGAGLEEVATEPAIGKSESPPPSAVVLVDAKTGDKVLLGSVLKDNLKDCGPFRTVDQAEADFIEKVKADPDYVARRIVAESSTMDRDDFIRLLDDWISDVSTVEELADLVEREADLKIVSADTKTPLYSTNKQYELESRLVDHARTLANTVDAAFDQELLNKAIKRVEADLGPGATLSCEQIAMLSHLDRKLLCAVGDPGVGKTVGMKAVKAYADFLGRDCIGLTISQQAANRLREEASIETFNTSKGLLLESLGQEKITQNSFVILDEIGMNDAKTAEALLAICRERNATAICIGDTKQLQPILSGQSLRIIRQESREAGTFELMTGIQRQKNAWHLEAVKDLADGLRAIETSGAVDAKSIESAVNALDKNGVFKQRDDLKSMIDTLARDFVAERAFYANSGGKSDTIYLGGSKENVRWANEAIHGRLGLKGLDYGTRYGTRQFDVGDTICLRENNAKAEIVNGDRATVIGIHPNGKLELLHEDGRKLHLNTVTYDAIDYGYVQTYHSAQGSSVSKAVMLLDRSASAELFFVGASRSKLALEILFSKDSFESVAEIAEHVASRSSLKTTSRNFEELIGSRSELDRKVLEDIAASDDHPLRRKYELIEGEKTERKLEALASLHARFAERRKEQASAPDLSLTERLDAQKELGIEHRAASKQIVENYKPVQFGRFVHDEVERARSEREKQQSREITKLQQQHRQSDRIREQERKQKEQSYER